MQMQLFSALDEGEIIGAVPEGAELLDMVRVVSHAWRREKEKEEVKARLLCK